MALSVGQISSDVHQLLTYARNLNANLQFSTSERDTEI